jgi:hypothetical protein
LPFSGTVTTDPKDLNNCVLTFTQLTFAGDTFSKLITATPGLQLILEFDYLGDPTLGGVLGNLGGLIGISDGFPAGHRWLAGASTFGGAEQDLLVDDGTWRHYAIQFDPFQAIGCCGYSGLGSFHVMLEDFVSVGGVAGDVFFDNIRLTVAPSCQPIDPIAGIDEAISEINDLGLDPGTTATLVQKLAEAKDKFILGDLHDARSKVYSFVVELEAAVAAGNLATEDANVLLNKAGAILAGMKF